MFLSDITIRFNDPVDMMPFSYNNGLLIHHISMMIWVVMATMVVHGE